MTHRISLSAIPASIFTLVCAILSATSAHAGMKCVVLKDRPSICIDDKKPMPMAEKAPLPSKIQQVIALAQQTLPSAKSSKDNDDEKRGPRGGRDDHHGHEHGHDDGGHHQEHDHDDHDHDHHPASP